MDGMDDAKRIATGPDRRSSLLRGVLVVAGRLALGAAVEDRLGLLQGLATLGVMCGTVAGVCWGLVAPRWGRA